MDIVFLQETWFDSSVTNTELVASTKFNVLHKDRDVFRNERKIGGGVAAFIRSKLHYTEVEHLIVRVKLRSAFYTFVNTYMPPYRTRLSMVTEVPSILKKVRIFFSIRSHSTYRRF